MSVTMYDPGDYKAATLAFLAANPYVLNLCPAERIKGRRMANEDPDGFWITAHKAPGGRELVPGVPIGDFTLDVWCYGSSDFNAANLDRRVRAALIAYDRPREFMFYDCTVIDVLHTGGGNETRDPHTGRPLVISTYTMTVAYARITYP